MGYLGTLRAVLVLAATAALIGVLPARADACIANVIPAYFAPGPSSPWEQVIASPAAGVTMILNPASGPGAGPDPLYQDTVRRAQQAGISVVGYVHTSWGARKASLVRAEIDRYRSWYGADGIFFDEAATSAASLSYYRGLYRHVKADPDATVTLNHGTVPDERYMTVTDVAVIFEGDRHSYRTAMMPAWASSYAPGRFADLVYDAPADSFEAVLEQAKARRVGQLYVTDDVLSNPWDALPSYYEAERMTLEGGCAAA